jgi:hypothetical protein
MNPILAIVLTLSLLAIFIASLIAIALVRRSRRRSRRVGFAAAAAARGWNYEERNGAWSSAFGVKPFLKAVGKLPTALDVVSGTVYGHRAVAFRLQFTKGHNPDTLTDIYGYYSICAVELPASMAAAKSFAVDRKHPLVKRVMLAHRRATWTLDNNWLVCWEPGENITADTAFDRLHLAAAIVEGQVGRILVSDSFKTP